jgi:OCT family organic cation transporter-like MFS transporter 4/5
LAVSLAYYGISFHIPDFSGDRHFNFIIGGALELVAYMISFLVMTRFGRRIPLCLYFFIAGCLCIATVAVTRFINRELQLMYSKSLSLLES